MDARIMTVNKNVVVKNIDKKELDMKENLKKALLNKAKVKQETKQNMFVGMKNFGVVNITTNNLMAVEEGMTFEANPLIDSYNAVRSICGTNIARQVGTISGGTLASDLVKTPEGSTLLEAGVNNVAPAMMGEAVRIAKDAIDNPKIKFSMEENEMEDMRLNLILEEAKGNLTVTSTTLVVPNDDFMIIENDETKNVFKQKGNRPVYVETTRGGATVIYPALNQLPVSIMVQERIEAGELEFTDLAATKCTVLRNSNGDLVSGNIFLAENKVRSYSDLTLSNSGDTLMKLIELALAESARTGVSLDLRSIYFNKKTLKEDNKENIMTYVGNIKTKLGAQKFLSRLCTGYITNEKNVRKLVEGSLDSWAIKNDELLMTGASGANNTELKVHEEAIIAAVFNNPLYLMKANRFANGGQDANYETQVGKIYFDVDGVITARTTKIGAKLFFDFTGIAVVDGKTATVKNGDRKNNCMTLINTTYDGTVINNEMLIHSKADTINNVKGKKNKENLKNGAYSEKISPFGKKALSHVGIRAFTVLDGNEDFKTYTDFCGGVTPVEFGNNDGAAEYAAGNNIQDLVIEAMKTNGVVKMKSDDIIGNKEFKTVRVSFEIKCIENEKLVWEKVEMEVPYIFAAYSTHEEKNTLQAHGKNIRKSSTQGMQGLQWNLIARAQHAKGDIASKMNQAVKGMLNEFVPTEELVEFLHAARVKIKSFKWDEVDANGLKCFVDTKKKKARAEVLFGKKVNFVTDKKDADFIFDENQSLATSRCMTNVDGKVFKLVACTAAEKGSFYVFSNRKELLGDIYKDAEIVASYPASKVLTWDNMVKMIEIVKDLVEGGRTINTDLDMQESAVIKYIMEKRLIFISETKFIAVSPTSKKAKEHLAVEISAALRAAVFTHSTGMNFDNGIPTIEAALESMLTTNPGNFHAYNAEDATDKVKEFGIERDSKFYVVAAQGLYQTLVSGLNAVTDSAKLHRIALLSKDAKKYIVKKQGSLWMTYIAVNVDQGTCLMSPNTFKAAEKSGVINKKGKVLLKRMPEIGRGSTYVKVVVVEGLNDNVIYANETDIAHMMGDNDGDMLRVYRANKSSRVDGSNVVNETMNEYYTGGRHISSSYNKLNKVFANGNPFKTLKTTMEVFKDYRTGLKLNESKEESITGKMVAFDTKVTNYLIFIGELELLKQYKTLTGAFLSQVSIAAKNNTAEELVRFKKNINKVLNGSLTVDESMEIFGKVNKEGTAITGGAIDMDIVRAYPKTK